MTFKKKKVYLMESPPVTWALTPGKALKDESYYMQQGWLLGTWT